MTPWELVLVGIASLLVLLTSRELLPGFVALFRPARIACWFLDSEAETRCLGGSPILEDYLHKLRTLRFVLLGVQVEKLPLWGSQGREVALVARDRSAFASIVLGEFGTPSSIYLYTPLAGGGMVLTRDYAGGRQAEGEGLSVRNVPTEDVDRLVRDHHSRVQAMLARGALLAVRPSQAGRLAATRLLHASRYFRKATALQLLPALVACALSLILLCWALLAPFLD